MTAVHHKEQVAAIISDLEQVALPADDPAVERLVGAYREKYNLGPRSILTERAERWFGAKYRGEVVAVCGDRRSGKQLEVTDAYSDGTQIGKVAVLSFMYAYRALLECGEVDEIIHACLYANNEQWEAIMRETGDAPEVLVFVHRRKGG